MPYTANQWEACFGRTLARIYQMRKRIKTLDLGTVSVMPDGLEIGDETVTSRALTVGERNTIKSAFVQIVNDLVADFNTGISP